MGDVPEPNPIYSCQFFRKAGNPGFRTYWNTKKRTGLYLIYMVCHSLFGYCFLPQGQLNAVFQPLTSFRSDLQEWFSMSIVN